MKALTISQPFASLIASGDKWIENRTWRTFYRGPLAIHAGVGRQYLTFEQLAQYPTRRIVAVCELVTCLEWNDIDFQANPAYRQDSSLRPAGVDRTWGEIWNHKHCEGPWCWILANARFVEPIEIRGAQGLWELPDDVAAQLTQGVER